MEDNDFYQRLKKDYIELEKYHKAQMIYGGLLMQAVTSICSPDIISQITYKHLQLCMKNDQEF